MKGFLYRLSHAETDQNPPTMIEVRNTVEPVYNGHPRDFRNWLLRRSPKILTGRGLMPILMAYHTKTLNARKPKTLSIDQYFKQSSMPTFNLTVKHRTATGRPRPLN